MAQMLSKNFSLEELRCKCGKCRFAMPQNSLNKLQALRDACGFPLVITSGHRCARYNEKVGGARHSYHIPGWAFDIQLPTDHRQRARLIEYAFRVGFKGFILYPSWLHVDTREDFYVARSR